MKKLIAAVLLGLVAIALVAPKFIGDAIQKSLAENIALLNTNTSYTATVTDVQQGWFSSSAIIDLALEIPGLPVEQQTLNVQLTFKAQHGPIIIGEQNGIARDAWTISYSGEALRQFIHFAEGRPLYSFETKTSLLGSSDISDKIIAFTAEPRMNAQIAFSGYHGHGSVNDDQISYVGKIETITLVEDDKHAKVENIYTESVLNASIQDILSGGLYDSLIKVGVSNITFNSPLNLSSENSVKNAVITAESKVSDDNKIANILSTYSVDSYDVMGSNGQNIVLKIDLNNLSIDFMKAYQQQTQTVIQNAQTDPAAMEQQMLDFFNTHMLNLLITEPELNISQFSGTIEQGKFSAQLNTKLIGIKALPDNLQNPLFWLSHIKADTHIDIDENIAQLVAMQVLKSQLRANPQLAQTSPAEINELVTQQAPLILQTLVQQGLIQTTARGYQLVAELQDGQATLNGKQIPLPTQ